MLPASEPALAWIGLNSIPGVGRATFRRLIERFGSPDAALAASPELLQTVEGLSEKARRGIASADWREDAERELQRARDAGCSVVTAHSDAFPQNLRETPDPPVYVYVRGTLLPGDARAIAIVGTRRPTHYGMTVAQRMAAELASAGFTIVSGLARGIDTQAHRGALAAQGRTIAVLGSGVDIPYPPENRDLLVSLIGSGAALSENPLGTQPESGYFPGRNRIISGLSLGTVIIEASEDSGSLITARYALEQGRSLFAVPGSVASPKSRGTNNLIRQGAVLVENAGDILRALGNAAAPEPAREHGRPLPLLTDDERTVLERITNEPLHVDQLMAGSGAAPGRINGILTVLELKGLIRQLPGKFFIRDL